MYTRKIKTLVLLFGLSCLVSLPAAGEETKKKVADSSDMAAAVELDTDGLEPVGAGQLADGTWEVTVDSSSSMFRIEHCLLTVKDGAMVADMAMGGTGYLYLYPGTGEEAAEAAEDDLIPYAEDADGVHHFVIPVEALDSPFPCAAYSRKKEMWYDRTLLIRSAGLPSEAFKEQRGVSAADLGLEDGSYEAEVSLEGGSGRASVESPAQLTVKDGEVTARIVWGSSHYDYMIVDGVRYEPVNTEGNSAFEIPVTVFETPMSVIADTTAMSVPYEIEYTLRFELSESAAESTSQGETENMSDSVEEELETEAASVKEAALPLYAKEFFWEKCEDGCTLITIGGSDKYLLVPEGTEVSDAKEDAVILRQPLDHIYLAASSAMDYFERLGVPDRVAMTSTEKSDWSLPAVREALEEGRMLYVGKYSAPDYEMILSQGTDIAVESTMIYHSPQIKEQLERLGIPVLVERSSYETDPLGRMEWIKLYGLLTGTEKEADDFFAAQAARLEDLAEDTETEKDRTKTVAYFYISSGGYAVVRKSGDYIAKMIEMAGGSYFLDEDLPGEDNALSTMHMEMESFYEAARDADIIIYNSSIDEDIEDTRQLLDKCPLLEDFKAVREGNVWCSGKNMFQQPAGICDMIVEMNKVITGCKDDEGMQYLHRVEKVS